LTGIFLRLDEVDEIHFHQNDRDSLKSYVSSQR